MEILPTCLKLALREEERDKKFLMKRRKLHFVINKMPKDSKKFKVLNNSFHKLSKIKALVWQLKLLYKN